MNYMRTWAETAEQFYDSLINEGYTLAEDQAKKLYELETQSTPEEVSEDELAAVSGGHDRDYATDGCAATVEYGSDCWNTDGGCWLINIDYDHMPLKDKCPWCGFQTVYMSHEGVNVFYYTCRTCECEFISLPWKQTWDRIK